MRGLRSSFKQIALKISKVISRSKMFFYVESEWTKMSVVSSVSAMRTGHLKQRWQCQQSILRRLESQIFSMTFGHHRALCSWEHLAWSWQVCMCTVHVTCETAVCVSVYVSLYLLSVCLKKLFRKIYHHWSLGGWF